LESWLWRIAYFFLPTKISQKNLNVFYQNLKERYCVIIKNIFTLLVKADLILERMPVTFCNEANNYGFTAVPV
jgi:hypothetical protein